MSGTQSLFCIHFMLFSRMREGLSSRSCSVVEGVVGIMEVSVRIISLFLVPSAISVAAVTVYFLISLLVPVNCSYLNL